MPTPLGSQNPYERIAELFVRSGARLDTASIGQVARGAEAKRTTTQNIPISPSFAIISFEAVEFDTDGFWTNGSPTRMTIPPGLGGLYFITGHTKVGAPHSCVVYVTKNGEQPGSSLVGMGGLAGALLLRPNDYVELRAYSTGAGSQSSLPVFTVVKF